MSVCGRFVSVAVVGLFACTGEVGGPAPDGQAGDPGQTGDPQTGDPQTGDPQTGDPQTGDPQTGDPQTGDPQAGDPQAGDPGSGPVYDSLPVPFDVGASYTTTLYVAESGVDDPGNGSQGSPFRSIGYAIGRASPGTLIMVADGAYPAIGTRTPQGSSGAPIKVQGTGGAIIDCASSSEGAHFVNPTWFVLEGITVQNADPHGLNIDDGGDYSTPGHHVVLRNLTVQGSGSGTPGGCNCDCIKMSGIDDFFVLDSDISGCNTGEIIDMVGCHRGFIHGNNFHEPMGNGVQTKGGSADIFIHGNRFSDIPERSVNAGGSTGSPYYRPLDTSYEGARIQIVANVFERSGSAPVAFVGCDTCVFANNTVIEPQNYVARILEENLTLGPGHSGYFINNIIVFNTADMNSWSYVNVGGNTQPATYTFGWNQWYALDNGSFSGPSYQDGVPAEQNGIIQQDPNFVGGGNYHVTGSLPTGTTVPRGAPADFDEAAYADPPTVGAFVP